MPIQVLLRDEWNGTPRHRADWFAFEKGGRVAVARMVTHPLGWELRLEVAGDDYPRTQVCKTQEEVFETVDRWRTALVTAGWTETGITAAPPAPPDGRASVPRSDAVPQCRHL